MKRIAAEVLVLLWGLWCVVMGVACFVGGLIALSEVCEYVSRHAPSFAHISGLLFGWGAGLFLGAFILFLVYDAASESNSAAWIRRRVKGTGNE